VFMSCTVTFKKSVNSNQVAEDPLLVKNFTDFKEAANTLSLSENRRRIGWLGSLIMPVRTDTLSNFCQDFFLPGLFNQALKTKDVASKIILCILMPIYDVITFPIRLISVIPRCTIYKKLYEKETHPLYIYLIKNNVNHADLSAGYVCLEIKSTNFHFCDYSDNTFNFMHLHEHASNLPCSFMHQEVESEI